MKLNEAISPGGKELTQLKKIADQASKTIISGIDKISSKTNMADECISKTETGGSSQDNPDPVQQNMIPGQYNPAHVQQNMIPGQHNVKHQETEPASDRS